MQIRGVGPLTALAIVATVGNAHDFKNGRQFAAWLGLVPRQYSTGGKTRLGHITRRGDPYLRTPAREGRARCCRRPRATRTALALGARGARAPRLSPCTLVAIAAKNARIVWALSADQSLPQRLESLSLHPTRDCTHEATGQTGARKP